ncbi:MAG: NUDIX hydrolase [Candidatus Thermoplasmatota archaeon]
MQYQNPRITADGILIKNQEVLLIKRKNTPFQGFWALPGGFVEYGETTEQAVIREVLEETGLQTKIFCLVGVYSDPKRDPRGHTITIAYALEYLRGTLRPNDDATEVHFFPLTSLPKLAFDHNKIIADGIARLPL